MGPGLQVVALARRAALHRAAGEDLAAETLMAADYPIALIALQKLELSDPPMAARLAVDLLPEADHRGDMEHVRPVVERMLGRQETPLEVRRDGFAWLALIDSFAADSVQRVPRILERLDAALALARSSERPEDRLFPLAVEMLTLGALLDFDRSARAAAEGMVIARAARLVGWRSRFEFGAVTIRAAADAMGHVFGGTGPRTSGRSAAEPSGPGLTVREHEVLLLLVAGQQNREIADRLTLSVKTVMHHTGAIYRKLGVRGRAAAAVAAVRLGIVRPN